MQLPPTTQPTPPFSPQAARKLRTSLGMGPEHVAYGMRVSYGLPHVTPDLVMAWEHGTAAPSSPELTALARVLWCSQGELIGAPRTLREHRVARGLTAEEVARAVGLGLLAYLRMEKNNEWRGSARQSSALAEVLDLSLPALVSVSGREEKLAELLRGACGTHRRSYARSVSRLLPLRRRLVEDVLQSLHTEYQRRMVGALSGSSGAAAAEADDAGGDFLERIVDHFWSAVQRKGQRPGDRDSVNRPPEHRPPEHRPPEHRPREHGPKHDSAGQGLY